MKKLEQNVIWITGASSGIGEALALALSKHRSTLVLSARRKEALQNIEARCQANGATTLCLPLDLAAHDELPAKVDQVIEAFGRIDILVNNGGMSQRALAHDTDLEVDRQLMHVNYLGTVALTKAVLPFMRKQGSGHIAVVSSLVGKFGSPYRSGYAASKHALHGFFDSLRAEVEDEGIHVTMICPGFINTNVTVNALTRDGSKLNQIDEATAKGLSPEQCAKRIMQALTRNQREVYIGKYEVWGVYLKRFLPGLFARILKRAKVR